MTDELIRPGYTRVSRILQQYTNFDHIDPAVLANKAQIGTNVHTGIQAEDEEGFPYTIGFDEQGYFQSCHFRPFA